MFINKHLMTDKKVIGYVQDVNNPRFMVKREIGVSPNSSANRCREEFDRCIYDSQIMGPIHRNIYTYSCRGDYRKCVKRDFLKLLKYI